jgi:hypothetical protein
LVPVLVDDPAVDGFLARNAPLQRHSNGAAVCAHPVEDSTRVPVFPLSKDLAAAFEHWKERVTDELLDKCADSNASASPRGAGAHTPDCWLGLCDPQPYPGLKQLDARGGILGLGWWKSNASCRRLLPGAYTLIEQRAAKADHLPPGQPPADRPPEALLPLPDDNLVADQPAVQSPCLGWWTIDNLEKCVRFFYESKEGAGIMGGLYRSETYMLPRTAEPKRVFSAFQTLLEGLQQTVLKFKGRSEIVRAKDIKSLWKVALTRPEDPVLAMDETIEKKSAAKRCAGVKDLAALRAARSAVAAILKQRPQAWEIYTSAMHAAGLLEKRGDRRLEEFGPPDYRFFVKGRPLCLKQHLVLDPLDPRYLFLPSRIILKHEDS